MSLEKIEKKDYVIIVNDDGTKGEEEEKVGVSFRISVPKGTPGSVERPYDIPGGDKGVKTEMVFNKLSGKITDINFFDGNFGELLQLTITDSKGDLVLSVSTETSYGEDIMKKLPAIDLSKEVTFTPYSFKDDNEKTRKGVTITQDGKKVENFFYDKTNKKSINGFPEPEGDKSTYTKSDWTIHFIKARKFLVDYIKKNLVKEKPIVETKDFYPTDEIDPNNIPF